MTNLQDTIVIRDRGQITIPHSFRKARSWIATNSAVTIITDNPDEIVLRPRVENTKNSDWNRVWSAIKKARAIKGRGDSKINLSEFIAKDRETGHSI